MHTKYNIHLMGNQEETKTAGEKKTDSVKNCEPRILPSFQAKKLACWFYE